MEILKKFLLISLIFLTSCSFELNDQEIDKAKEVFSEQLNNLYEICEDTGKKIGTDISFEKANGMLEKVISTIPEEDKEIIYKGIEKGITIIENGKEVLANQLEIDLSVEGAKEEIEILLEKLSNIDARISVENVDIEKTDDNYKLDCTINFFYSSSK